MKKIILVISLSLTACAPTIATKPGTTQADLNRDLARCRMALSGTPMPYQNFNSGLGIGNGMTNLGNTMSNAVDQHMYLRNCMEAQGWTISN